ncbi:hypothetical protein [Thermococcus sp.]|uniref:hypothetical protein n=1 Tax=Thermococcus sp. TaxID=35749 RepID=UPI00262D8546|nr:hypothetical protein [Thermococcus sp.]
MDADGNVKWQKTYGGKWRNGYWGVDVALAPNGDIVVVGESYSLGGNGYEVLVLRLDENGKVKWQKTYGGRWDDRPMQLP